MKITRNLSVPIVVVFLLGLAGGVIYDALIARVALKSNVDRLLTLNIDHFTRAWPDGEKIISLP